MPLYEYQCKQCGAVFERLEKASGECAAACPGCGEKSRRLMSRTSFVLKGTGWYATDYANSSTKPADTAPPAIDNAPKGTDSAPAATPAAGSDCAG